MSEIVFKSHNIDTFQSLDSDVIHLCNRKSELHTVRKESVTISDLKVFLLLQKFISQLIVQV